MKALSIKQPWATLILLGKKDIENRNWRIGRNDQHGPTSGCKANFRIELPTRIYVHAGKQYDRNCLEFLWDRGINIMESLLLEPYLKNRGCMGAIVGEVDIVDCVLESESPWFVGKYGFVLENPVIYPNPIPYAGQLGFFNVESAFNKSFEPPAEAAAQFKHYVPNKNTEGFR